MSELKLNEEEIEKYASYARNNLTVIELTYCYAELKVKVETLLSEVDALVKQNEKYRSCLQWYACIKKDMIEQTSDEIWDNTDMLAGRIYNYGKRAREALEDK